MPGSVPPRRSAAALVLMALLVAACSPEGAPDPEEPRPTAAPTDAAPGAGAPDPSPDPPAGDSEAEPEPPPLPPEPASRAALVAHVEELLAAAEEAVEDATVAVLVTDAYGRELGGLAPDTPVLPASTLKIVTAAATLVTLGADARLTTRVDATAPIGDDGVLDGDLTLVGVGDPTLGTPEYGRWIYPARPRTPLEELADELVDAGLTRVTGDVHGMAPGFAGPSEPSGWLPRYFADFDARYVSGLTVDGGLATSIRWPQLEEERALQVDGPVDDAAPDEEDGDPEAQVPSPERVSIPLIGTRDEIEERLAGLDPPLARVEVVPDPRLQAADELRRLLIERGVTVDGQATVTLAGRSSERGLASVDSPPMADVLRFAVQRSDNHLTDQLFQVVSRVRTGGASWPRGERAVKAILDELGIDHTGSRFADGSGLSRDDRVTARLLVDLDRAMWSGEQADTWASFQAVAGESGTLRQRLTGTPAAGRFFGKTGTLSDVTAVTGAVLGDDGERYHLAVVGNDAPGADRWVVRALMDELVLALVADLQGCELLEPDEDAAEGPLGRPPVQVAC
ncbi:D-alanyl-D-alanine carboxypeptidase/D-alanyl-D-alanine-endopeptidase [Egicoccus sp. AB-alg2]|uniref:D-alanyl-D-alanine carboxypeptidase/D-alanyl-D-alanine endopeptidase n=1 Tax=Egicoccus sp. AB-alg2 TaxID=3242693 RepID=UPI00359DAF89